MEGKKIKSRHTDCITPLAASLLIIFVILRLCGVISWSWWWVTSPLWIWGAIIVIINIVFLAWLRRTRKARKP